MSLLKQLLEDMNIRDMMSMDSGETPDDSMEPDRGTEPQEGENEYDESTHDGLVKFFTDHEYPSDEEVHQLASDMGLEPDELEEQIYALLHAVLKGVGKHNGVPDEDFDPEQLARGIQVEREHTNNDWVAKMIAKDHLSEIPNYYTLLDQMEQGAGVGDSDEGSDDTDSDEREFTFTSQGIE